MEKDNNIYGSSKGGEMIKDTLTGKAIPALKMTRKEIIEDAKEKIKIGYEISWFTTDERSYEWGEVNEDIEKFFKYILSIKFKEVFIGYFNQKTKDTIYEAYEVII